MPAPDVKLITHTIFREDLDMRVVDDYDKAKKSIVDQEKSKAKIVAGTDLDLAVEANAWFKRTAPMKRKKKQFDDYVGTVRAAVEGDLRADVDSIQLTGGKITDAWIGDQTKSLVDRYYLDEGYAARIIAEMDFDVHVDLQPVADLKAVYDRKARKVSLTWKNPNDKKWWGNIELVRDDLRSPQSLGKVGHHDDENAEGGQKYRYDVTVVGKDGKSKSSPMSTNVVCVAEIAELRGDYHG